MAWRCNNNFRDTSMSNINLKRCENSFPRDSAIYFLIKKTRKQKGKVVYIGLSGNVYNRIRTHRKDKDFDYYRLLGTKSTDKRAGYYSLREKQLISKFKPKYNTQAKKYKWGSPYQYRETEPFWSMRYKTFLKITYNRIWDEHKDDSHIFDINADSPDEYYVHNIQKLILTGKTKRFAQKCIAEAQQIDKKSYLKVRTIMGRINRQLVDYELKNNKWETIKGFKKYKVDTLEDWQYDYSFYRHVYKYKTNGKVVLL